MNFVKFLRTPFFASVVAPRCFVKSSLGIFRKIHKIAINSKSFRTSLEAHMSVIVSILSQTRCYVSAVMNITISAIFDNIFPKTSTIEVIVIRYVLQKIGLESHYSPPLFIFLFRSFKIQKQPSRGVLRKRCPENMQEIYRRTPMSKCDFSKVALQFRHGCSPVNLLHIFRTSFLKNTSGGLLLKILLTHFGRVFSSSYKNIPTANFIKTSLWFP